MNSIRTKMTLLTVCAIVVAMTIATLAGVVAIRNIGNSSSEQLLYLLCESGEKNLDSYFESVEQSVEMVSAYVESDLKGVQLDELDKHLERVKDIFAKMTYKTEGVLTYYYRIDPEVSKTATGFWFVNLDGAGFKEHEPTDITQYDTDDTSQLVWFTIPKATGKPVWQPPYITDNLDVRVLSYNVPIYKGKQFIGVVGIEIDYTDMACEVNSITLYDNGYAFVNDVEGNLIYHPRMDITTMENPPKAPEGISGEDNHVRYTYEGVEKQAVWLPLSNGMRLNVTVPVSEVNADWQRWIYQLAIVSIVLLIVFILITMHFTGRITKPLRELTEVAEQLDRGNYDARLDYAGNDEVGVLAKTFNRMSAHMKSYISDLNDLAYADALTQVHNKGAYDIHAQRLQLELSEAGDQFEFAIAIFDCNNLKPINDEHGHDKGNIYLRETSEIICNVFDHSPVFRVGGDEFAVILLNTDYENRDRLLREFDEKCAEKRASSDNAWEQVDVARGIAAFDPQIDTSVNDVARRADRLMYQNKWEHKRSASAEGDKS